MGKLVDGDLVGALTFVQARSGFLVERLALRPADRKDAHLIEVGVELRHDLGEAAR